MVDPDDIEDLVGGNVPMFEGWNSIRKRSYKERPSLKKHCGKGHEFTKENTGISIRRECPVRHCKICAREYSRRYYAKQKELQNG